MQLGPHEVTSEYLKDDVSIPCCQEVSKLYLMDVRSTTEISHAVAQYLNFSVVELRSFLNMFYEVTTNQSENVTLFLCNKIQISRFYGLQRIYNFFEIFISD